MSVLIVCFSELQYHWPKFAPHSTATLWILSWLRCSGRFTANSFYTTLKLMIGIYIEQVFLGFGVNEPWAGYAAQAGLVFVILLLALVIRAIGKQFIRRVLGKIVTRTRTNWDDILYQKKVFDRMLPLLTWLVLSVFLPLVLSGDTVLELFLVRMVRSVLMALVITALGVWLEGLNAIYETLPASRVRPMKGYVQLVRIFLYGMAGIVLVTALLNISPVAILSGFGAASAVLLLVFRDTLLGLVSGVQLTSNDMVRLGDWIEMPKYGADGDVIDINLQTVKVRNWDMTITTIPIYALISDSFKNWRGMSESGGRRIMRNITIDAESVGFLSEKQIKEFESMELLGPYIRQKLQDIQANPGSSREQDLSRRHLSNLGTFRAYMELYLDTHPGINKDMIHMVRQLQSTSEGIPLQVYAFTRDKAWIAHEKVQADIFDHLFASVSRFGLRVYQHPSGGDIMDVAKVLGQRISKDSGD